MYVLREPCPLFVIILWCLLVHGSHTPISYVYTCTKFNQLQACIEPHPLIDCCCRRQKCYPCSMSVLHAVQSTCIRLLHHSHLFKAHPGACKFLEPHTALCITPLLYLLVITGNCTYLQYSYSTNSNKCLGFSYPGQI